MGMMSQDMISEESKSVLHMQTVSDRWNRSDIVREKITSVEAGKSEILHAALAEFRSRVSSGSAPQPERDEGFVAQFDEQYVPLGPLGVPRSVCAG
jgi:hypothetical protein